MRIPLSLSPGDFIDRLVIARVKAARLNTEPALASLASYVVAYDAFNFEPWIWPNEQTLRIIHERLWDKENTIRQFEASRNFSWIFISTARDIYRLNDQRSAIKKQIDEHFGEVPEEKVYTKY